MNKYQTNVPYDESRNKHKKASGRKDEDEKQEIFGKMKGFTGHAGPNCTESYKTIWKASMGK